MNRFRILVEGLMKEFDGCDNPEKILTKAGFSADEMDELGEALAVFHQHFVRCLELNDRKYGKNISPEEHEQLSFMQTVTWVVMFGMKLEKEKTRFLVGSN